MTTETTTVEKDCTINIRNFHGIELDEGMLKAVLERVRFHIHGCTNIEVFTAARVPLDAEPYKNPGWLEWTIRYEYRDGGKLTVGAIQRTPGAGYEFHS